MFLKLKTLHFLDSIHIAIFVYASSKKKNVSHARCCTPLHMEFLIVFPLHMSWVHFDYRWFPRVSLESPSPTVSTSALWRVQTLTLYSHMQMKLHMHDEKYDVDIFAACSQLEILRRKKKVIRCWPKAIIEAIIEAAARYKIHMEHLHSRPVPAEPRAERARLELSAVVAPWPCVAPFLYPRAATLFIWEEGRSWCRVAHWIMEVQLIEGRIHCYGRSARSYRSCRRIFQLLACRTLQFSWCWLLAMSLPAFDAKNWYFPL